MHDPDGSLESSPDTPRVEPLDLDPAAEVRNLVTSVDAAGPPPEPPFVAPAPAPKPRVWSAILLPCIAIPAALIVSGLATVVPAMIIHRDALGSGGSGPDAIMEAVISFVTTPLGLLCSILPAELPYLALVLGATRLSPLRWRERLAMTSPHLPWWAFIIFALATPMFAMAGGWLAGLLGASEESTSIEFLFDMFQNLPAWLAPLAILLYALAPGFAEEMCFRGYVQSRLLQRWHPFFAIGLASILFAIAHADPTHSLLVWPLGVWLGIVAWRTGTIWPAIVCHAAMNAYGVSVMIYISPDEIVAMEGQWTPLGVIVTVVSAAALLASCGYLFFKPYNGPGKAHREEAPFV